MYEYQPSYFGPESLNSDVSSDELKFQKDLIKKGYQRKHEVLSQRTETKLPKYLAGRRNGSAKIVDRYFEDLLRIWNGSLCDETLPFGASNSDINVNIRTGTSSSTGSDNNTTEVSSCSEDNSSIFNASSVGLPPQHGSIINLTDDVDDHNVSDNRGNNKNETIIKSSTKKGKTSDPVAVVGEKPIPKLVDNKRRDLERKLSSSQRDKLMNRKSILNLKGTSSRQFERQIKHLLNRCSKSHSR